jgi:hypothetical protein
MLEPHLAQPTNSESGTWHVQLAGPASSFSPVPEPCTCSVHCQTYSCRSQPRAAQPCACTKCLQTLAEPCPTQRVPSKGKHCMLRALHAAKLAHSSSQLGTLALAFGLSSAAAALLCTCGSCLEVGGGWLGVVVCGGVMNLRFCRLLTVVGARQHCGCVPPTLPPQVSLQRWQHNANMHTVSMLWKGSSH